MHRRLTIDLAQPEVMATVTDLMKNDEEYRQCEFPSVNPAVKGKDYRSPPPSNDRFGLYKHMVS